MARLDESVSAAGRSIEEIIWDELDKAYAELKVDISCYANGKGQQVDIGKGKCLGLATALAIIRNPYNPDVDTIREEAQERWAENQD